MRRGQLQHELEVLSLHLDPGVPSDSSNVALRPGSVAHKSAVERWQVRNNRDRGCLLSKRRYELVVPRHHDHIWLCLHSFACDLCVTFRSILSPICINDQILAFDVTKLA
jgi:hypothetical protein